MAVFFDLITDDLDRKVLQFPVGHLNLLISDLRWRIDDLPGSCVLKSTSRKDCLPSACTLAHRHQASVPVTPIGNAQEPLQTSRSLDLAILILNSQEEKLVAQAKRQMLEEGGIQVRP